MKLFCYIFGFAIIIATACRMSCVLHTLEGILWVIAIIAGSWLMIGALCKQP